MEDLIKINTRCASIHLGTLSEEVKKYLSSVQSCVVQLLASNEQIISLLQDPEPRSTVSNSLDVVSFNVEYLEFARLVSKDILAGQWHAMLMMSLDLQRVKTLANLSNQDIRHLSLRWNGSITKFCGAAIDHGHNLKSSARLYHSSMLRPQMELRA